MSLLRSTLKSTYELARELQAREYRVSAELVRRLSHQLGYSLQAPAKQNEGESHPDRDGQFVTSTISPASSSRREPFLLMYRHRGVRADARLRAAVRYPGRRVLPRHRSRQANDGPGIDMGVHPVNTANRDSGRGVVDDDAGVESGVMV